MKAPILIMEARIFYLSGVVALGIAAQWLAWRFRLPAILLLLGFGFAFGYVAEELSVPPLDVGVLFPIVSLSVAVILFEGGLTLRIGELREAGRVVLRLVTLGAAVTWLLTTLAAMWLLDFRPGLALIWGAIMTLTGPTVIGPLLRNVRPQRLVGTIAKWEGIVIDPIGAVLAVLAFEVVRAGQLGEAT